MVPWLIHHWIALSVGVVLLVAALYWLLKPPSWRDGEGDNQGLVDIGSFRQLH